MIHKTRCPTCRRKTKLIRSLDPKWWHCPKCQSAIPASFVTQTPQALEVGGHVRRGLVANLGILGGDDLYQSTHCLSLLPLVAQHKAAVVALTMDDGSWLDYHDIEHPTGRFTVDIDIVDENGRYTIRRSALLRTARKLMDGNVYVPEGLFTC